MQDCRDKSRYSMKQLKTASRYKKCNISVNRHTGKKNPMGKGGYTSKAIILEAWNLRHSLELRGYLVRKKCDTETSGVAAVGRKIGLRLEKRVCGVSFTVLYTDCKYTRISGAPHG